MKKLIKTIAVILVAVILSGTVVAYGITLFQKTLAGIGQMTYTNEVTISDVKVKSLSRVDVTLESNAQTVADRIYSAYLYLDDVKVLTPQTTNWTAGQIPGVKNKISFTGLSLGATTLVEVEVIY